MAVDTETPALQSAPKGAGTETRGTGAQRSGRRLSPSEVALLQAMIAEAEAMRRRLTAAE